MRPLPRGLRNIRNVYRPKFGSLLNAAAPLPTPPIVFGQQALISDWGILGNDTKSCCTEARIAHQIMLWGAQAGTPVQFTPDNVVTAYSAITGYDPSRPDTDQGSDVDEAMTYWRTNGIRDAAGKVHYIDMFADIPVSNVALLTQAAWIMGSVGVGFALPDSADKQFSAGEPWDDVGDPPGDGHDVPIVGRNSAGNYIVVTWGRTHAATPRFLARYLMIVTVPLSLDRLTRFPIPGFDRAAAETYVKTLS